MLKVFSAAAAALFLCLPETALAQNRIGSGNLPTDVSLVVPDYTALSQLSNRRYDDGTVVLVSHVDRGGRFVFSDSDLASAVTADSSNCIYVAPAGDPTGASGAWTRLVEGELRPEHCGAAGNGTANDRSAIVNADGYASTYGVPLVFDGGKTYAIDPSAGSIAPVANWRTGCAKLLFQGKSTVDNTRVMRPAQDDWLVDCLNLELGANNQRGIEFAGNDMNVSGRFVVNYTTFQTVDDNDDAAVTVTGDRLSIQTLSINNHQRAMHLREEAEGTFVSDLQMRNAYQGLLLEGGPFTILSAKFTDQPAGGSALPGYNCLLVSTGAKLGYIGRFDCEDSYEEGIRFGGQPAATDGRIYIGYLRVSDPGESHLKIKPDTSYRWNNISIGTLVLEGKGTAMGTLGADGDADGAKNALHQDMCTVFQHTTDVFIGSLTMVDAGVQMCYNAVYGSDVQRLAISEFSGADVANAFIAFDGYDGDVNSVNIAGEGFGDAGNFAVDLIYAGAGTQFRDINIDLIVQNVGVADVRLIDQITSDGTYECELITGVGEVANTDPTCSAFSTVGDIRQTSRINIQSATATKRTGNGEPLNLVQNSYSRSSAGPTDALYNDTLSVIPKDRWMGVNGTPTNRLSVFTEENFDNGVVGNGDGHGGIVCGLKSGGTQGEGEYGCGVSFTGINTGRRRAGIAPFQATADPDQMGLAFFGKNTTTGATDAIAPFAKLYDYRLDLLTGSGALLVNGTQVVGAQGSAVADTAFTFTANDPSITPDGGCTIADGSAPTAAELQECVIELADELNTLKSRLEDTTGHGLIAQ